MPGGRPRRRSSTPGRRSRGPSGSATPRCSPWRSPGVGHAETWAAEVTPGLLERGVEIEERLGLSLEYYESPRVALGRLLVRSGEIERARAILEELEAEAAARGDEARGVRSSGG